MNHRSLQSLLAALLAALLVARSVGAQVIELRLRESDTQAPVVGAIVRLLRDTTPVAQTLSSQSGRAVLRAPASGRYRVRVSRIGFRPFMADLGDVEAGVVMQRVVDVASVRVALPAVAVRARRGCDARGDGTLAASLWDEIRTALDANLLTEQQGATPLHLVAFQRDVALAGKVQREWTAASRVVRGQPYASLPPDSLARRGFVYDSRRAGGGDETTFAVPDAALLLSGAFVATHCFRAVGAGTDSVGLAFEPLGARRVPDVRGTLWVDRASSELRALDYTYTGLPDDLQRAGLGGRVEFRRLASGAWIVGYWHVRMPRMEAELSRGNRLLVASYVDQGGRVDTMATSASWSIVAGVVYDSASAAGLPGVVVRVRGLTDSVVTDSAGRYELAVPDTGAQTVVAAHPRLAVVAHAIERPTMLTPGETTVVDFALPSTTTLVGLLCVGRENRSGIVGVIRAPEGVSPDALAVRVWWTPNANTYDEYRGAERRDGGLFAICDLPPLQWVSLRLQRKGAGPEQAQRFELFTSGAIVAEERVQLKPGEYRWVELRPYAQRSKR